MGDQRSTSETRFHNFFYTAFRPMVISPRFSYRQWGCRGLIVNQLLPGKLSKSLDVSSRAVQGAPGLSHDETETPTWGLAHQRADEPLADPRPSGEPHH